MNLKRGRVAALAATLIAMPVLAACGGETTPAPATRTLDTPAGPGSFVGSADDRDRAFIAKIRDDQKAGRLTNQNLAALTDEQLLAIGKGTCTAKEQGASDETIEKTLSEGMPGVSQTDVTPYVSSAIDTLCAKT